MLSQTVLYLRFTLRLVDTVVSLEITPALVQLFMVPQTLLTPLTMTFDESTTLLQCIHTAVASSRCTMVVGLCHDVREGSPLHPRNSLSAAFLVIQQVHGERSSLFPGALLLQFPMQRVRLGQWSSSVLRSWMLVHARQVKG